MQAKFLIPLLVFIVICVLLAMGLTRDPKILPSTLIDKTAPSFALPNVVDTDTDFSSEQLEGQKWILNVWASWCVSCRVEHPLFNQLAQLGIAPIIGLNYKDEHDKAQQWLAQRGNPYFATPMDESGIVGINWGVVAVPETFIINEHGRIIYKHTGPIDASILQDVIIPILNGQLG